MHTLSNDIRLHVSIVVLASPKKATAPLDTLGNHVINKPMLEGYPLCVKQGLIFGVIQRLKHGLEGIIIDFQNRIFCR